MSGFEGKIAVIGDRSAELNRVLETLAEEGRALEIIEPQPPEAIARAIAASLSSGTDALIVGFPRGPTPFLPGLRRQFPDIAIIGVSLSSGPELFREVRSRGADELIETCDLSVETLESALESARARAGLRLEVRSLAARLEEQTAERNSNTRRMMAIYRSLTDQLEPSIDTLSERLDQIVAGVVGPLSSEQREYLEIARRGGNQLKQVARDLGWVVEASDETLASDPEVVSVRDLFAETIAAVRARAVEADVQINARHGGLSVVADRVLLGQLLSSLLDNALKFTPEGGTVSLEATQNADQIQFVVSDTGCGIAVADRKRVFERLQQSGVVDGALEPGLGLGLSLCRSIAEHHGGSIAITGDEGIGTTLVTVFPYQGNPSSASLELA